MTRPTQTRAGNFVRYARISVPVTRPALAVGASLAFHE
jgi:ABC-type Fe3+ transport system permease subunit